MNDFRVLLSYHYFGKPDLDEHFAKWFGEPPWPEVFADSGAFSAFTQGAVIDVHEYAAWIKRWQHLFTVYANLDVIGAAEVSAEGTARNQQILEDEHGLAPLPVFHAGEPWGYLDSYLERYSYIALGGMVGRHKRDLMPWLVQCFKKADNRAVYHGFGLTSWEPVAALRWYSVDSSSWGNGYRYGTVSIFDPDTGHFINGRLSNHADMYEERVSSLIRGYGFDPADFADRKRYSRARMCALSATSWRAFEAWLRSRHGPVRVPDSDRGDGCRVYLADGSGPNLADGLAGIKLYLAETDKDNIASLGAHSRGEIT